MNEKYVDFCECAMVRMKIFFCERKYALLLVLLYYIYLVHGNTMMNGVYMFCEGTDGC